MRLGYSLIEMLMTLTIASILLVIVIPSQYSNWQHSKQSIIREQLFQAIQLTRQMAIASGATATLCPSNNQQTCSGSWNAGYLIDMQAETVRVFTNPTHAGQLYWRSFPANQATLVFTGTGATQFENGTFWYCESGATSASWAIVISQMGRARVELPDSNGHLTVDVSCHA